MHQSILGLLLLSGSPWFVSSTLLCEPTNDPALLIVVESGFEVAGAFGKPVALLKNDELDERLDAEPKPPPNPFPNPFPSKPPPNPFPKPPPPLVDGANEFSTGRGGGLGINLSSSSRSRLLNMVDKLGILDSSAYTNADFPI